MRGNADRRRKSRVHEILALIIVMMIPVVSVGCDEKSSDPVDRAMLMQLNDVMGHADIYVGKKRQRLDSLKKSMAQQENRSTDKAWNDAMQIAQGYNVLNSDSALLYAEKCISLGKASGDSHKELAGRIAELSALSVGGFFAAAHHRFDSLSRCDMNPELKIELWKAARQLYSYMSAYSQGNEKYYHMYNERYKAYDDSLLSVLPEGDRFARFVLAERLVGEHRYDSASKMLLRLMEECGESHNIYAMAAFQLSEIYRQKNDKRRMAEYLVKASIGDIKGGITEGWALPALANMLYSEGYFDDARRYVNYAIDNAALGNTRMRLYTLALMVPGIEKSYSHEIESSQRSLVASLTVVFVLLAISLTLLVALRKKMVRVKASEEKLTQTSRRQDAYIGHFLGLCSTYADRLDALGKLVVRKLKAGQNEDLLKIVSSGRYLDEGNDEFYKTIDNAFLDLYPDFVGHVNSLLREDARIEIKEKGVLTPELRIYAFVRLGVAESSRIAQILHYSSNTVYAYRHRMRKRALSPDTFDQDILSADRYEQR